MDKAISDHPNWFAPETTDERRTAAIDVNFDTLVGNSSDYQNADEVTKQEYRVAHKQLIEEAALNSEHNPSKIRATKNRQSADSASFLGNTGTKMVQSHQDLAGRTKFVDDLIPGSTINPKDLGKYWQKQNEQIVTHEQKQLATDIQKFNKTREKDGFWNDAGAWGQLVLDVVTNPGAVIHTAAESSSSITAMGTGAKVGALAGPVGAAAGMFAAETADAGTAKYAELMKSHMQEQGYALTPTNIQSFIKNNPDLIKDIQQKSIKYGATLGLVDVLSAGLFSKLATLPTRAARQAAIRSIDDAGRAAIKTEAAAMKISVKDYTDMVVSGRAQKLLKDKSFKKKLGSAATAVGGEVASEPLSEAIATAAIGEEIKAEDLIYETIGGIGAGPFGAAINIAALGTKTGTKKTKETVKKAAAFSKKIMDSTPESRAAEKTKKATLKEELVEQKTATKQAKEQKRSEVDIDFKKDVASVEEATDERIDQWIEKDPIKAATALAKFTDPESINKVRTIHNEVLKPEVDALKAEIIEMEARKEDFTSEDNKIFKSKLTQFDAKEATREKVFKQIQVMKGKVAAETAQTEIAPVEPDKATDESVVKNITDSYGSHGNPNALQIDQIDQILTNEKTALGESSRDVLVAQKEALQAREEISKNVRGSKSMQEVQEDIYQGDDKSDFKGIDAYSHAIKWHLNKGNNKAALKELSGLQKFSQGHQEKHDKLSTAYQTVMKAEDSKEIIVVVKNNKYKIHKNSGNFIGNIASEVDALNKEVVLAEKLLTAHNVITSTKASDQARTPTVDEAAAPVVEKSEVEIKQPTESKQVLDIKTKNSINSLADKIIGDTPINKLSKDEIKLLHEQSEAVDAAIENRTKKPKEEPTETEQEIKDPIRMDVKYTDAHGSEITKSYTEAMTEIETEIEECQGILRCLRTS